MSQVSSNTQKLSIIKSAAPQYSAEEVLFTVHNALVEKGYDPINQIVGYLISGDPTYITGHNGARNLIGKTEREDLLEELLRVYLDKN